MFNSFRPHLKTQESKICLGSYIPPLTMSSCVAMSTNEVILYGGWDLTYNKSTDVIFIFSKLETPHPCSTLIAGNYM